MEKQFKIPSEVSQVTETLQKAGFKAYIVGGCVRDLIMDREPKDWDVTTNADPKQIQALFQRTFYENEYGTVGVVNENVTRETLKVVEVTPFRIEGKYSDYRHPDSVRFADNLEDDLKRRDFTMNAIAYDIPKGQLTDPHKGHVDIRTQTIKTVGQPDERFMEDALRIIRAIRFASELCFTINKETGDAMEKHSTLLSKIPIERVREEFTKIIMSENPMAGIVMLQRYGILKYIVPELEEGLGIEQNGDHIYEVWEHNLRALNHSADRGWPLDVRIAALLHDVGKPRTRFWSKEKNDWIFYGHDVVGGKMTSKILSRLKFSNDFIDKVSKLVRYHLFFSDIDKITLSAVRRIVKNVSPDNVWDLMKVRACDRIGMGRPKETPYRLRKYESMIEEAMRSPISVGMLKIDGNRIMQITKVAPGPKIGYLLHALLEEVLDDPSLNTTQYLEQKSLELIKLTGDGLKKLGESGKESREKAEGKEIGEIRSRHGVK